jgi:hypothetical protein
LEFSKSREPNVALPPGRFGTARMGGRAAAHNSGSLAVAQFNFHSEIGERLSNSDNMTRIGAELSRLSNIMRIRRIEERCLEELLGRSHVRPKEAYKSPSFCV